MGYLTQLHGNPRLPDSARSGLGRKLLHCVATEKLGNIDGPLFDEKPD